MIWTFKTISLLYHPTLQHVYIIYVDFCTIKNQSGSWSQGGEGGKVGVYWFLNVQKSTQIIYTCCRVGWYNREIVLNFHNIFVLFCCLEEEKKLINHKSSSIHHPPPPLLFFFGGGGRGVFVWEVSMVWKRRGGGSFPTSTPPQPPPPPRVSCPYRNLWRVPSIEVHFLGLNSENLHDALPIYTIDFWSAEVYRVDRKSVV